MSYEFRMPNVSGTSTENQVRQILSFLHQHIQELNYVVSKLEKQQTEEKTKQGL